MRIIHFTEQPILDYMAMVERGRIMMPRTAVSRPFLKTVEEQKQLIKQVCEDYNSAKIIVDGQIVPNLAIDTIYTEN